MERESYPIHPSENTRMGVEQDRYDRMDEMDEMEDINAYIKANIEYDSLVEAYPFERREIEELVNLMVDVIVSKKPYIRINGCDMPYQVVRSTFEKQNYTTIEYILVSMRQNTTKVRNIRSYMLTALYNAPLTCNNYYKTEVNHDLHGID